MKLEKLNELEIGFLNALSWNLNVPKDEFHSELENIENELSKIQMAKTNMFTYNNARNINLSGICKYHNSFLSTFLLRSFGPNCSCFPPILKPILINYFKQQCFGHFN